ncbi:hypothetical protein M0R45_035117 [Rubus argutus]|uniref:Secreted protein n=1 Tax=Rubus argutus TaxID=59490 RepID=A0AAW1VVW2_RUBAR
MPSLSPPQPCFIALASLCTSAVDGHNHHQSSRSPPLTTTGHCNLNQTQTEAATSLVFDASHSFKVKLSLHYGVSAVVDSSSHRPAFQRPNQRFCTSHLSAAPGSATIVLSHLPKSSLLSNLPLSILPS